MLKPSITVQLMRDSEAESWNHYVLNHAHGTVFHLAQWRTIIEQALGHQTYFLVAKHADKIVGILPLAETKSFLFGHHFSSLPFCMYNGPLADSDDIVHALLSQAEFVARERGAIDLEIRSERPLSIDWPRKDLYVCFRRDLSSDHDENLKAIPRKQRAMVRKAISNGLTHTIDQEWGDFLLCYDTSIRNLGTPAFPRKYFSLLKKHLGAYIDVLTVRQDGKPLSSVLSFYFNEEVLPYYGGGLNAARQLAANDFMYWQLMVHAVDKGIKRFDFGRSKKETGAYAFKKNWGFEPTELHYHYCLIGTDKLPELNPNNPKYALMIKIWQRFPLFLHRLLGPMISRHVG